MEDVLIELLSSLGYEVYRQGSFAEGEKYPDNFFTFWQNDSDDHAYYNNSDYGTGWRFNVNFYSVDPAKTYEAIAQARTLLKQNNWIVPSKGYDVYSDEPTHTGRGLQVQYLEV